MNLIISYIDDIKLEILTDIKSFEYIEKHLRWTMAGPHSSYSCLEIHICWKVEREARMDPPIQTEYFLSGGAMILILMVEGARAVISFCIRSAIPGYMVVTPDMTVLAYRSFLMPTSHFMMELKVVSWIPQASIPRKEGWKRASGHLNLVTDGDDLTVGQLIGLLQGSGSSSSGHLLLEVEGDIAEFLLDVPDNLPLGSGGEGVATLSEDLHQVVCEFTTSEVQTDDGVRETVTCIHDDTSGATRGVQREDSLDGHVHRRHVE